MTQPYTKSINGFEVEFDCSEEELETLEDKLNLITLGNEKGLLLISCDETGCKPAKLKVRHYGGNKFGEIEIESDYTGMIATNCSGVSYDPEENSLTLYIKKRFFSKKQLVVRIKYNKKEETAELQHTSVGSQDQTTRFEVKRTKPLAELTGEDIPPGIDVYDLATDFAE